MKNGNKAIKALPAIGAAALVLGACQAEDTAANNESEVTVLDGEAATDPATADLNLDAAPSEVDRAINQTDAQSNLDSALEDTTSSTENGM